MTSWGSIRSSGTPAQMFGKTGCTPSLEFRQWRPSVGRVSKQSCQAMAWGQLEGRVQDDVPGDGLVQSAQLGDTASAIRSIRWTKSPPALGVGPTKMDAALIFLLDVTRNAALTLALAGAIGIVGLPLQMFAQIALPTLQSTLGTALLFGLSALSITCWYAFSAGISLAWADRFCLIFGLTVALVGTGRALTMVSKRRETIKRAVVFAGTDAFAFLISVILYLIISVSKLKHDSLPWLTIGNNDLLAYLKMGSYLLHFPNDLQVIDTKDLHEFAANDVFGSFNLMAFGSFMTRSGLEDFALPVMAFAIGMIGMAITRCCRRTFKLDATVSLLIALVMLTCPLISYVTLNYFLGQMLLVATLLVTTLAIDGNS